MRLVEGVRDKECEVREAFECICFRSGERGNGMESSQCVPIQMGRAITHPCMSNCLVSSTLWKTDL